MLVEILLGVVPQSRKNQEQVCRGSVAVLVPAHNESAVIANTLESIKSQMKPGDRLIVIADNCTDNTGQIARELGAELIERIDLNKRGKGFALDFGIQYLELSPPNTVILIDADCLLNEGSYEHLVMAGQQLSKPVQAIYLMHGNENANLKTRVAEFAWAVKNRLRAMGAHQLGMPCHLKGSGIAIPWDIIHKVNLANAEIVEDLKMGIDFAIAGYAPILCPDAIVCSSFPVSSHGMQSQRKRWEHGHIGMIMREFPKLMALGLKRKQMGLVFMALDLSVPPLALLMSSYFALLLLNGIEWLALSIEKPWYLSLIGLSMLIIAMFIAWWSEGRKLLSLSDLVYIPIYVIGKIPLYIGFLVNRQVEWIRSSRDKT
ncbi:glycosyltransferase family 2 protein [Methylomonas sp. AM2-LC]|uniref:glycosyltransferase family 2 protein n=1 Tax=Methylomonas sp. AM2-LC TaxID=3153301 RepID=UPI003266B196